MQRLLTHPLPSAAEVLGFTAAPMATARVFTIKDTQGDNYVDKVTANDNGSFTIYGRNNGGQPRQVTINNDGSVVGHGPGGSVGLVGQQMADLRQEIFDHFSMGEAPKPSGAAPRF